MLFARLFTGLDSFPPRTVQPADIQNAIEGESAQGGDAAQPLITPPPYDVTITPEGDALCTLTCGTVLRQPVSVWYTLGCQMWCHARGLRLI